MEEQTKTREWLLRLRKYCGMPIDEFARRVGLTPDEYIALEDGESLGLDMELAALIAFQVERASETDGNKFGGRFAGLPEEVAPEDRYQRKPKSKATLSGSKRNACRTHDTQGECCETTRASSKDTVSWKNEMMLILHDEVDWRDKHNPAIKDADKCACRMDMYVPVFAGVNDGSQGSD